MGEYLLTPTHSLESLNEKMDFDWYWAGEEQRAWKRFSEMVIEFSFMSVW